MRTMMIAVGFDNDVTLVKQDDGSFEVTYGKHLSVETTFEEALAEFNNCVKHSAQCAGILDSE